MGRLWLVWALLSSLFASWIAILSKVALTDIPVILFTTIGSCIITLFFIVLSLATQQWNLTVLQALRLHDWLLIVGASGVEAISWLFYFRALAQGPITPVVMIDRLSIVFTVIFATILFSTPLTPTMTAGIVCMVIGIILLSL